MTLNCTRRLLTCCAIVDLVSRRKRTCTSWRFAR